MKRLPFQLKEVLPELFPEAQEITQGIELSLCQTLFKLPAMGVFLFYLHKSYHVSDSRRTGMKRNVNMAQAARETRLFQGGVGLQQEYTLLLAWLKNEILASLCACLEQLGAMLLLP